MLRELQPPLLTCWPVITEAAYLLRSRPEEVYSLVNAFQDGFLHLVPLDTTDLPGIRAILDQYEDQRFQLADASLMHLTEREEIKTVFTLDRRDFSIFRTAKGTSLQLVPKVV